MPDPTLPTRPPGEGPETQARAILEQINAVRRSLTRHWDDIVELPEVRGCEALLGRKVLYIDDSPELLSSYAPGLITATGGQAEFYLHSTQSELVIVNAIKDSQADLILMDGLLARSTYGWDIVRIARENGIKAVFIGFSTDAAFDNRFSTAGANGFVTKSRSEVQRCLREVAAEAAPFFQAA